MEGSQVRQISSLINSNGVRIVELSIAPKKNGAWHLHSNVREYSYCLKGHLSVDIEGKESVVLSSGEKVETPSGIGHSVRNESQSICHFLVVQGVGEYDFVEAEKSP